MFTPSFLFIISFSFFLFASDLSAAYLKNILSKNSDNIFFRYATDKTKRDILNQILEKEEGIRMASQTLQTISMNPQERRAYEEQIIFELDQRSERANAKKEAFIEVAKGLKLKNIPLDVILETIPLSRQEVEAL